MGTNPVVERQIMVPLPNVNTLGNSGLAAQPKQNPSKNRKAKLSEATKVKRALDRARRRRDKRTAEIETFSRDSTPINYKKWKKLIAKRNQNQKQVTKWLKRCGEAIVKQQAA